MTAFVGKYELQAELARGGMGVVYRALDPVLRRACALKLLLAQGSPELTERFLREARALARLRHPGIVEVYDAGVDQGRPFLVMELLEGGTLADLLQREGPLEPRRACELVDRVARAVDAAHADGILHRDLKPANVLLAADGAPRVTDFGLARDLTGGERAITLGDQVLGTPSYMSPEQAGGELRRVGPRSDVYALGAVLFELLTGRPPYEGATPLEILTRILSRPVRSPRALRPDLPLDLEWVVRKAMAREPDARYDSAAALAADLRRFLEGRPCDARPVGALERGWRWARRNKAGTAAALAVLALAGGAVALGARLGARRQAAAVEAEERGRAALARGAGEDAERELREAARLAPERASAWLALARAALGRGALDDARAALARAGGAAGERGERAYVAARLAEAAGEQEVAAAAYAQALEAGCREPDCAARDARVRARLAAARGWARAAEEAWWQALRADAGDAEALAALVRGWVEARDVEALGRGWEAALERLGHDGAGYQSLTAMDQEQVARALADDAAPLAARVRAAAASPLYRSRGVQDLMAPLRRAEAPLLAEAARAAGLWTGDLTLEAWAAAASPQDWAQGGAAALTLLERAARLGPGDAPALLALARARGPLLRAAVALAVAVAASRDPPLPPADAAAVLEPLLADGDEAVRAVAADAAAALACLAPQRSGAAPSGRAVRLALALLRAPERAGERPQADLAPDAPWVVACAAALTRAPSADLFVARAEDALERAPAAARLDAARADVRRALELEPGHLGARALRAQLRLAAGEEAPALAPLAGEDPLAHAEAARRVEFTRAFGLVAGDAGGGAVRLVVRPDAARAYERAFDVLSPRLEARDDLLRTEGVTVLRSRFTLPDVRWITIAGGVDGGGPIPSYTVRAHAPVAGGPSGFAFHVSTGHDCALHVDGALVCRAPATTQARRGLTLGLRRGELFLGSEGATIARAATRARLGRSAGHVDLEWGWGDTAHLLRRLTLVGRWDGRVDTWPAPRAPAALRPAPDDLRLGQDRLPPGWPATLGELRAKGARLPAQETWVAGEGPGNVLFAPGLRRDLALRARVALRLEPENLAGYHGGLALRASDGAEVVWLNMLRTDSHRDLGEDVVWLYLQRGVEWHKPIRCARGKLEGWVLSLERRGDHVVARGGPSVAELQDLGPPVFFPFDGPVDACLMGRRSSRNGKATVTFSEVELLVPAE